MAGLFQTDYTGVPIKLATKCISQELVKIKTVLERA